MIANTSQWVRAPQSGILRALVAIGSWVESGERLAIINDPLGENPCEVTSPLNGVIIGKTNLPLVFAGEALFNIAAYAEAGQISDHIEAHQEELAPNGGEPDDTEPPLV
jgi:hypothetical protein